MAKGSPQVVRILNDMELVLNVGRADGVTDGTRFLVFEPGDEVLDPDTQESLGRLEIVRGIGEAKHVQERMTTIRSTEKKTVRKVRRRPIYDSPLGALTFREPIRVESEPYDEYVDAPFVNARTGDLVRAI